ncbi:MAG: (Fe-S)-binding protein [Dehalobacterium sp.]
MNGLREIRESVLKCAKCGDCQSVCPIYRETKKEGSVARGRLAVLRFAAEGEIPFDNEVKENIYECLMCGSCAAHCTSDVPVTDIIFRAKEIFAREKVPLMQQFMFNHFLPYPGRLKLSHRLLKFYRNTGLRPLLKKSGFLNVLGSLAKAEDFIPRISSTFRDQEKNLLPNPQDAKYKLGYFLGCATNLLRPVQGMAAVNFFRKAGCRVEIPETFCCGLPVLTYGQTGICRELAKKNIDIMLEQDFTYIVSDCVSCSSQLKDFVKLFDKTDPYYEKAWQLSEKVLDFAQVLIRLNHWEDLLNQNGAHVNQVLAYHVPCHMARGLKAEEEAREVLKAIKGIKYVELPEADTCCGAAGSYLATHPELSLAVLKRKMENIRATGAHIIVTSCPECVLQLERGARTFHVPVKVMHLAELI